MSKKLGRNVLEVIPVRKYNYQNECYECKNGSILDIASVKCKDFNTESDDNIERDMIALTEFFRVYKDDFKLISINIPTNCTEQIAYINHKIDTCKNEYRRDQLEVKKKEQEWIQKNRLNKEFYIMYFARDLEEFRKNRNLINEKLGNCNLLNSVTKRQKDIVLMKMNNKNIKS